MLILAVIFIICAFRSCEAGSGGDVYKIGVGIADVTGPAAEINMMGYAKMSQSTSGIHIRQYARSFIIQDSDSRILFISLDTCMTSQLLHEEVVKALQKQYGNLYNVKNVCVSGTHTHSSPGGFLQYVLYDITSQGFVKQSFDALLKGIMKSVKIAHENIKPGYLFLNSGDLYNSSINRSPTSYLNNPPQERARYNTNVDTKMVLLKMTDLNYNPIGMINWFAVHCTSMNNTNVLISGDNKGYASMLFEQRMNKKMLVGQGPFVAAFAQTNEGDVSPNIRGPHCIDSGMPCDINSSTCDGKSEKCIAFGPGTDMFDSTKIIATRQYKKSIELFDDAAIPVSGSVSSVQQFINMTNVVIPINETTNATTCRAAMGYSFAAGTTDGPGEFDFKQGTTSPSAFWNLVRDLITKPSKDITECQKPKPILLATGEMTFPYKWQADIVPTQILKVGQLYVVAVPAEFTTMSGRRTREAVKQVTDSFHPKENSEVVIAGLSNAYTSYVATYEEYQVQRYEGASTIFGAHTLQAYIQQFRKLAHALCTGEPLPDGPDPPNYMARLISLQPGVFFDAPYYGKKFGDVTLEPEEKYAVGDTVKVNFVSGHPRNDLQLGGTFLTVERLNPRNDNWTVIATDANWETKYIWNRTNRLLGHSECTVLWEIPPDTKPGKYRIRHFGHSKSLVQKISPYTGTSQIFVIKKS